MSNTDTLFQAATILKTNQFTTTSPQGKRYVGISPSNEYYHHAWFWDTIFHIMALVHIDPELAVQNLTFLIDSQWDNGHIGHIIYRFEEVPYFPDPTLWKTESKSKSGIISSGIIQPPILAVGLRYLYDHVSDNQIREYVASVGLAAVEKYHQYLKKTHDTQNSGLISIFHSWSSGSDNAIIFDRAIKAIALSDIPGYVREKVKKKRIDDKVGDSKTRPLLEDYYRFLHLVHLGSTFFYDSKKISEKFPFAVKDISVNSLWYLANNELGRLLFSLGRKNDAKIYLAWAEQTKSALFECWDEKEGGFSNVDVHHGGWVREYSESFANFMPFLTGDIPSSLLDTLFDKLEDPHQYGTDYPVPSTPINHPQFELKRYWRGPTWPGINYFLINGLQRMQQNASYSKKQKKRILKIKKSLVKKTQLMIEKEGFYENFSPIKSGESGNGFANFSWTAAVYILLHYMEESTDDN